MICLVSSKDKAPEVRGAAAQALATLALNSPGGVSSNNGSSGSTSQVPGAVPLETTLALCVKGNIILLQKKTIFRQMSSQYFAISLRIS